MKSFCRTVLLGATVAVTAMFSTAHAQKAGGFNPTGQALTDGHAYEQYKIQYIKEHPQLFNEATTSKYNGVAGFQATGNEEADNARYEAEKIKLHQKNEANERKAKAEVISQEAWDAADPAKRAILKANPEQYNISDIKE